MCQLISLINPPINDRRADCFDIILSQTFFLCIVKSPVQKSGAGVRLIRRSMSGSVQLKNLGLKSLTTCKYTCYLASPFGIDNKRLERSRREIIG